MAKRAGNKVKATDREVRAMKKFLEDQATQAGKSYWSGRGRPPRGQQTIIQALAKRLKMSRWSIARALAGKPRNGRKVAPLYGSAHEQALATENGAQSRNSADVSPGSAPKYLGANTLRGGSQPPQVVGDQRVAHHFPTSEPVRGRGMEAIGLRLAPPSLTKPGPQPVGGPSRTGAPLRTLSPTDVFVRENLEEALHAYLSSGNVSADARQVAEALLRELKA